MKHTNLMLICTLAIIFFFGCRPDEKGYNEERAVCNQRVELRCISGVPPYLYTVKFEQSFEEIGINTQVGTIDLSDYEYMVSFDRIKQMIEHLEKTKNNE